MDLKAMSARGRRISAASVGDERLGALKLLPGKWKNTASLNGRGWNMIALPFGGGAGGLNYRLLVNQYNETLEFTTLDEVVPNRGIDFEGGSVSENDQILMALDYEQTVTQLKSADFPESGLKGGENIPIHHEPGLWLHVLNNRTADLDIGRMATIPHGDSVLAMGRSSVSDGAPEIENISGLPIGLQSIDLNHPYLSPYKEFSGEDGTDMFLGLFNPVQPNELLVKANEGVDIVRTTELTVDTRIETGGVVNIPFVTKQANAGDMRSTFWIQELSEKDEDGEPKLRLQYSQTVMLDFFERKDGKPGLIRWPHVSINTMEKVS